MKLKIGFLTFILVFFVVVGSLCFASDVFAAEEEKGFLDGSIWKNIMLWINFGILVFFFMKYARKPLIDFLRSSVGKIKEKIDEVNGQLKDISHKKNKEIDQLEKIEQKLNEIRKNILEMGQREKEKLIEQGKLAAEKMVQEAKAYSIYKLSLTKKAISDEMVDMAVSIVEEKIKKGITEEDNDKLIDQFMNNLAESKQ